MTSCIIKPSARQRRGADLAAADIPTTIEGISARSLVLADGMLLSSLLGNGAGFTPRRAWVTSEEIERVDVLYGPFSAAYAGNSVGAVVDYQTRMPKAFEAHLKLGLFRQPFKLYRSGWPTTSTPARAPATPSVCGAMIRRAARPH